MRRLSWIFLLTGCSAKSDVSAPDLLNLTGTYTDGSYCQSTPLLGYEATVGMAQTGAKVAGTMYLPAGTAFPLAFTGEYSRDTVKLVAVYPLPTVGGRNGIFAVSDGGKHLVGTFTGLGSLAGQISVLDLKRSSSRSRTHRESQTSGPSWRRSSFSP